MSTERKPTFTSVLGLWVLAILAVLGSTLVMAFVISHAWNWLVLSKWPSVAVLTADNVFGLVFIFVALRAPTKIEDKPKLKIDDFFIFIFRWCAYLLIAYIASFIIN
jgi:hypothetical protein